MSQLSFMEQLEAHDNEPEVRERIAKGEYNTQSRGVAEEWLRRKEGARAAVYSAERSVREKETLAVAKEANEIARSQATAAWRAARYAMYAAVIAAIAAIISAKDQILPFIFGP